MRTHGRAARIVHLAEERERVEAASQAAVQALADPILFPVRSGASREGVTPSRSPLAWLSALPCPQLLVVTVAGPLVTLYMDGQPQYAFTASTPLSLPAAIGYFETRFVGSTETWDGSIDQVRLYNRALTQPEVSLLASE